MSNAPSLIRMSIGETGVESSVANILSKPGAKDRDHAVTIASRIGIIEL